MHLTAAPHFGIFFNLVARSPDLAPHFGDFLALVARGPDFALHFKDFLDLVARTLPAALKTGQKIRRFNAWLQSVMEIKYISWNRWDINKIDHDVSRNKSLLSAKMRRDGEPPRNEYKFLIEMRRDGEPPRNKYTFLVKIQRGGG